LVHESVGHYFVLPLGQLFLTRQFSVDQQESHFQKTGGFCQLFDRVAPVLQDPFVPVDVANFGGARNRVHESRVVRSQERMAFVFQFLKFRRQNIVVLDRDFMSFTSTVVSHCQAVLFRVS
jgi:hypothetical protein